MGACATKSAAADVTVEPKVFARKAAEAAEAAPAATAPKPEEAGVIADVTQEEAVAVADVKPEIAVADQKREEAVAVAEVKPEEAVTAVNSGAVEVVATEPADLQSVSDEEDDDEAAAILLDNGTGMIKAGFAGDDSPKAVFPAIIGRQNRRGQPSSYVIGDEAHSKCDELTLSFPLEHGVVTDWDGMEAIWHHTFYNELRVSPKRKAVLLTEPPFNPKGMREKMVQIMFETFQVAATYVALSPLLSLYGAARSTGLVVDSGDGVTCVMPVYEGVPIPHAIFRTDLSGRDLTTYMLKLLGETGYTFTTAHEREIARDIKEKLGRVALDFDEEFQAYAQGSTPEYSYELPDGNMVTINGEAFRCTEPLFQPWLAGMSDGFGLHEMVHKAITKCDADLHEQLYRGIVVAGGCSMFSGIGARLEKEITAMAPPSTTVRVILATDRKYMAWIGASVMTSYSAFDPHEGNMWITKEEYDENGPPIVHRKCY